MRALWLLVAARYPLAEADVVPGTGGRAPHCPEGRDKRDPPRSRWRQAWAQPTTNVGTLPPPALTLMTELREARVTAPTGCPAT